MGDEFRQLLFTCSQDYFFFGRTLWCKDYDRLRFYAIESACKSIFQFNGFKMLCKCLHIIAISAALIDGVLMIQQQI